MFGAGLGEQFVELIPPLANPRGDPPERSFPPVRPSP